MESRVSPCHILQFGYDDSVFRAGSKSDTLSRQVAYGEVLERLRPDSVVTIVIVTQLKTATAFTRENVTFIPFCEDRRRWAKIAAWYRLYRLFHQIDCRRRVDVLTTQTVHDESWIALLFGKFNDRPVIGQVHYDIFSPHVKAFLASGLIGKVRYAALLKGLKWFTGLRVVGKGIAREVIRRNANHRVHVIPVAMPMILKRPVSVIRRSLTVLFVGRLVEQKDMKTWLDVAELVARQSPQCHFRIVGDGPLHTELQERVDAKGMHNRVTFDGAIAYDKLSAYYESAAVLLLTSYSEGFGRVVAEALYHQLPVVAFRVTGVEDIIQDGESGFLHELGEKQAMADSVLQLLNQPITTDRMGKAGQEFVSKHFDPLMLSERWIGMLVASADGAMRERPAK